MKSFIPNDIRNFIVCLSLVGVIIFVGYGLVRIRNYKLAIASAWVFLLVIVLSIERLTFHEDGGYRMLIIIIATLFAMKIPVTIETYKNCDKMGMIFFQWLAFTVGWFGMRPRLFETLGEEPLEGAKPLILLGLSRVLIGTSLLIFTFWISQNFNGYYCKILVTAILLAGLSFILHFGILNISAGMWRLSGVDTRSLFRSPLLSTSLTEFWGRRWNLAFSEMTAITLYRPLKNRLGITSATIIAFLFSGLLHEMAISVPVNTGYGLPMLYFLIQGFFMVLEKWMGKNGFNISKNKVVGRLWVIVWLVLPMPILFHKAFIKEIIWPIIGL